VTVLSRIGLPSLIGHGRLPRKWKRMAVAEGEVTQEARLRWWIRAQGKPVPRLRESLEMVLRASPGTNYCASCLAVRRRTWRSRGPDAQLPRRCAENTPRSTTE
jgi:hypothetical protein